MRKTFGIICLILVAVFALTLTSYAYETAYADYYVYVNSYDGGLNLRSGPSSSYAKVMSGWIPNNTQIHITATSGNWGKTNYSGYEGWVSLKYTTTNLPETKAETKPEYEYTYTDYYVYVNSYDGGLNLRSGPASSYAKVMSGWIPNDTEIHITRKSGNWGYTHYGNYEGWVYLKYTTTKQPKAKTEPQYKDANYYVYVSAYDGGLNLRSGPSSSYDKVMSGWIPNNTEIHITAESGKWGYTTYNGYNGWVYLKYTTTKQPSVKKQETANEENPAVKYLEKGDKKISEEEKATEGESEKTDDLMLIRIMGIVALLIAIVLISIIIVVLINRKRGQY